MNTTYEKLINAIYNIKEIDLPFNTNASEIENSIKKITPVKTGALKSSISVSLLKDKLEISMLYYGVFVNSGTKYIKPRYFIEKGILSSYGNLEEKIMIGISNALINALK